MFAKSVTKVVLFVGAVTRLVTALGNYQMALVTNPPTITSSIADPFTVINMQISYQDYNSPLKSITTTLQKVNSLGKCVPNGPTASVFFDSVTGPVNPSGNIDVNVKYIHSTISTDTVYYSENLAQTEAYVKFCVNSEYSYDGTVYGKITVKVTVTTDLTADCKFCPITLENTDPIDTEVDKEIRDDLTCSLCPGSVSNAPFQVGETVEICVQYPDATADICVSEITEATLYQSLLPGVPETTNCYETNACINIWDCLPCFLINPFKIKTLVFDGETASIEPYPAPNGCGYKLSFLISNNWFTGVTAGNVLGIHIEALLEYGNNRRLGEGKSRELASVPVSFTGMDVALINCDAIKKSSANLQRKKNKLAKKLKNASGKTLANLRKQLANVNRQANALKKSEKQCA